MMLEQARLRIASREKAMHAGVAKDRSSKQSLVRQGNK